MGSQPESSASIWPPRQPPRRARVDLYSRVAKETIDMASAEAEALKGVFRQLADAVVPTGRVPTLEEQRSSMSLMAEMASVPEGLSVTETYAGGCRAYWHDPAGGARDRVILYVHGGGYVLGSPKSHERLVGHLARAAGCRALNLDYRLAPEHPHPAAVEDATAAYRWLLAQGFSPKRIVIAGDSAGGGLTIATLVALRAAREKLPAAGVCLSPWVDLEGTGESMTPKADLDPL